MATNDALQPDSGFLQETPDGGTEFTTAFRGGFGASATKPAEMTAPGVQMADASSDALFNELMTGGGPDRVDDDYRAVIKERANQEDDDFLDTLIGVPRDQPQPSGLLEMLNALPSKISTTMGPPMAGVATEAGHWTVGGPMRFAESLIDTGRDLAYTIGGPGRDENGNWKWLSPEEVRAKGIDPGLPNIGGFMDAPETPLAAFLQGATQFMTGFMSAGKVVGVPGEAAGMGTRIVNTVLRAGLADFFGFQGNEPNIANMLPEGGPPAIAAIRDYLAVDEETPELLGRLKRTVAGLPFNVSFEGVLAGLRRLKAWRKSQGANVAPPEPGQPVPGDAAQPPPGSRVEEILGSPDQEIVSVIQRQIPEVDLGVPLQVAAKSLLPESSKAPDIAPGMVRLYRAEVKGSDIPIGPDVTDDLSKAQADLKALGGLERGNQISYWDVPKERAAELTRQAEVPKAQQGASSLSRIPTFDDIMAVLPKDANGDVDAALLTQKIQSLGKKSFNDLSVSEKVTLFKEFGGTAKAQAPDAGGPLPLPDATQQPSIASGGTGQPPNAPPPATSAGAAPKGPPFSEDVYINWAAINTPDDVKRAMGMMADAYAPQIEAAQRGIVSNAETAALAGDENAWKLLIGERKGNLPNAHEQLAMRRLWAASGEKLIETSRLAAAGGPAEMIAFRKMLATHNMIQQTVLGVRTETARALQQWKIPAGSTAEQMRQLEFMLQNGGGEEVTRALAERIAVLAHPEWRGALDKFALQANKATSMDLVREFWINSILSGPKTHLVNMMSNSFVIGQSVLERAIAGQIGDILDPVDGVKIGEAMIMSIAAKEATKDMLRYAWRNLMVKARLKSEVGMESPFYSEGRNQLDLPRDPAWSASRLGVSDTMLGKAVDMVGTAINLPGMAMRGEDTLFKTVNYRMELWAQAYRQSMEEVQAGVLPKDQLKSRIADIVADPPENIRLKAADLALYNTFTAPPGKITKSLITVRRVLDETFRFPIGTALLPFLNTPGNIMKYTFERTPLAPVMAQVRADLAAGGARRDLALARMGLGTVIVGIGLDMAMNGEITGRGPAGKTKPGERQARARAGWQPYSVRVDTGRKDADGKPIYRYFAYNRLDPVGGQLAMAADLVDLIKHSDTRGGVPPDLEEILTGSVLTASQVYLNKSYLSGFAGFLDAVHDPDRYGEGYFTRFASSFVPTGVAEIAKSLDPVAKHVTGMLEGARARTPGLSEDVPPRLDFWGKEITYESGIGSLYDTLSPVYSRSTEGASAIDREFFKLDYFPTHPGFINVKRSEAIKDEQKDAIPLRNMPDIENRWIRLTSATQASTLIKSNEDADWMYPKQKRSYIRTLAHFGDKTLKEALNAIVTGKDDEKSKEYAEAGPDEKKDMISDVISAYRNTAREQVVREFPKLRMLRDQKPARQYDAEGAVP